MTYKDIADITNIVESFENATIDREAWGHAEHMIVALYYLSHHDPAIAKAKMHDGIMNLLTTSFRVDLTKEMPYHETLTVFWMRTVATFNDMNSGLSLTERTNKLVGRFDKDYPLRFYSREYLFSDEARANFVEGDL